MSNRFQYVYVASLEEYDKFMAFLDERGYTWASEQRLLNTPRRFKEYDAFCARVDHDTKTLTYASKEYFLHSLVSPRILTWPEFRETMFPMFHETVEDYNLNARVVEAIRKVL